MDERTKQDRHETPSGVAYVPGTSRGSLVDRGTLWDAHRAPQNPIQALMEAAPFCEPAINADDLENVALEWTELLDTMLEPKERAAVECIAIGGMSLREAGLHIGYEFRKDHKPYSKPMVATYYERGMRKLRSYFNVSDERQG